MGLLEKALKYKQEMKKNGRETIMDRIQGPADTDIVQEKNEPPVESMTIDEKVIIEDKTDTDLVVIDKVDLVEVTDKEILSDKLIKVGTIRNNNKAVDSNQIVDELDSNDLHPVDIKDDDIIEVADDDNEIIDDFNEEILELNNEALLVDKENETSHTIEENNIKIHEDKDDSEIIEELRVKRSIDEKLFTEVKKEDTTSLQHETDAILEDIEYAIELDEHDVEKQNEGQIEKNDKDDNKIIEELRAKRSFDENIQTEIEKNPIAITEETNKDLIEPIAPADKFSDAELSEGYKFQDFMILYENGKEILQAESKESLFDIILFSVMGQLGVSSSSIMVPSNDDINRWIIIESRGVTIADQNLYFESNTGILNKLIEDKKVIDLDIFKDDPNFRDDYFKFISIDARLAIPLIYDNEVIGIVFLGDKLSGENYSAEDKDFVFSIGEFAAIALRNILFKGKNYHELDSLEKTISYISEIDAVREKIISENGVDEVESIICNEFKSIGIESFAIYIKDNKNIYSPIVVDKEDYLLIKEDNIQIKQSNYYITYILESENPLVINLKNPVIYEVYDKSKVSKMSTLRVYPFKIGRSFLGFIQIFKVSDANRIKEIDIKMKRFSDIIFPYLINIRNIDETKNKFIDNIDMVFRRIDGELSQARTLQIPLTLVLFSIKNYKRFYNLYGYKEVKHLIEEFEIAIRSKLSEGDFSIRYDRHKILVVLPGKDKKYAVPFASAVCNDMIGIFKKPEMQLLVTYLTAEFPTDGEDLYSLIDAID